MRKLLLTFLALATGALPIGSGAAGASAGALSSEPCAGHPKTPRATPAALSEATSGFDADGDGRDDVVVPAPFNDTLGKADSGGVHLLYGGTGGVDSSRDVYCWSPSPSAGDWFGSVVATGDFDGDGRGDIAGSAPRETAGGAARAGVVYIVYSDGRWRALSQGTSEIADSPEAGDWFGSALAAGDFDGDGYDDLAIGVPREDRDGVVDAGAVHVLLGSRSGLRPTSSVLFRHGTSTLPTTARGGDLFGARLVSGDLDGDGRDDLAIGIPGARVSSKDDAGSVRVLYGNSRGLGTAGSRLYSQETPGIRDAAEVGDGFGSSLATGDFDDDGNDDLAAGAPFESLSGEASAGAVHVLYGTHAGLGTSANVLLSQSTDGISDTVEAGDRFGLELAAGDLDGDGDDDLAIGTPFESIGGIASAGSVHVLYGSGRGLRAAGSRLLSQESTGIADQAEGGDVFGRSVSAADLEGDGRADLLGGAPGENHGGLIDAGVVHVLRGSRSGLTTAGSQRLSEATAGFTGPPEADSGFGRPGTGIVWIPGTADAI